CWSAGVVGPAGRCGPTPRLGSLLSSERGACSSGWAESGRVGIGVQVEADVLGTGAVVVGYGDHKQRPPANKRLQRTLGPLRLSRVNGSPGPNAAEPLRSAASSPDMLLRADGAMKSLSARAWFALAILTAVMGLLLFVPAGTVHYWQAWVY